MRNWNSGLLHWAGDIGQRFLQYLWGIETFSSYVLRILKINRFYSTYEELKLRKFKDRFIFFNGFYSTYEELKRNK